MDYCIYIVKTIISKNRRQTENSKRSLRSYTFVRETTTLDLRPFMDYISCHGLDFLICPESALFIRGVEIGKLMFRLTVTHI